jgi:membrane fusion protein (multidrug efflux system)
MRDNFYKYIDVFSDKRKKATKWTVKKLKECFKHVTTHPKGWLHFTITVQLIIILSLVSWISYTFFIASMLNTKTAMPEVAVEAEVAKATTFEQFINTVGTLRSNQTITIKPEIDGKIEEIFVKSGQFVEKGDVLIQLNDRAYVAQLKDAEAKLKLATAKHERAKLLQKRGAGKKTDREEAYASMLVAEAEVEKAKSQLEKTIIISPFEGFLGMIDINLGQYLKIGEDLITLDDTSPIKVDFRIPERLLTKVKIGDIVSLEIEGFEGNSFEAEIESIDTVVDPLGHSIRIRASFENLDNELRPGLFANVKIKIETHENVITVKESAVESLGNQEYVYVIDNGIAKQRGVKTGERNGDHVEILKGLTSGQNVIHAGQMKIQHNFPVYVVPPATLQQR